VPDEVLRYLAAQLRGNVRELEGALHSLRHYSRVTNRPIDVLLAREALSDLLRHAVRGGAAGGCRSGSSARSCVWSRERCNRRTGPGAISHPRMVAMFLARKHTAASYNNIGGHFGQRNHSTAVAAGEKSPPVAPARFRTGPGRAPDPGAGAGGAR